MSYFHLLGPWNVSLDNNFNQGQRTALDLPHDELCLYFHLGNPPCIVEEDDHTERIMQLSASWLRLGFITCQGKADKGLY